MAKWRLNTDRNSLSYKVGRWLYRVYPASRKLFSICPWDGYTTWWSREA